MENQTSFSSWENVETRIDASLHHIDHEPAYSIFKTNELKVCMQPKQGSQTWSELSTTLQNGFNWGDGKSIQCAHYII